LDRENVAPFNAGALLSTEYSDGRAALARVVYRVTRPATGHFTSKGTTMKLLASEQYGNVSGGSGAADQLPPGIFGVRLVSGTTDVFTGYYYNSDGNLISYTWNDDQTDTTPEDYQNDRQLS
jgi:YD repeat-containing protein